MIWFFGMQLFVLGYGSAYLVHSVKKKRIPQAIAIAALLFLQLAAAGLLLWEYRRMP
ncbi:MAG: hypothetical protein IJJ86_04035 [Clostridia bacterium]|nr:hypothetical protein [Clostridia bacterium]